VTAVGAVGGIHDARTLGDLGVECDFCVVGSGPGGSIAAAVLAAAGANVAIVEEGGHYTRRDFNMQESWAYPALYQDHGNRTTEDLAILILQGRTVGGGTTVNWTSSFRTPERTLALWRDRHGVRGLDAATLAPHFAAVEQRLSIKAEGDPADVNANNRKLYEGADKLGWKPELIRRSVRGCARLGYCGMGCPLDAKQSALVTYVPDALAAGARLYTNARARLVENDKGRARAVICDVFVDDAAGGGGGARAAALSLSSSPSRAEEGPLWFLADRDALLRRFVLRTVLQRPRFPRRRPVMRPPWLPG
jgi:choline dehydrogenase-like flavoprotein